ncbi:MAG: diguanylate cyclase, partial [Devosia sp.]
MLAVVMANYRTFERMVLANQRSEALSRETLRIASEDSITGLPNRQAFFTHLEHEYNAAKSNGTRLAVAVLDLDRFKPINDLYGHSVGDKVLFEVGQRLTAFGTKHQFYLARLDSNAFAIVFGNAPDDETITSWAEEMCLLLRMPFVLPEATIVISTSIGVAVLPDTACTWEELLDRADYALDCGKRAERGCSTIFSAVHYAKINRDALIEQMLKQVDLDDELRVVFQPIVDVRSNQVESFEALARWHNPILGETPPHEFFAIAERAGLVGKLTRPLFRKALFHARQWPQQVRLSFNLSAHDLNSTEGVLAIVGIVEASGFDAHRLDFEITETAFAHDFEQVQQSIQMLRRLGCGMSLDDFGTGYSSLARLHALPLTKIKIDRQFVTDIHLRPPSYKIVKSLLALSRDMELGCVVEGVETEEELAAIIRLGGSLVQGYYYSRPLPADSAVAYLLDHNKMVRGDDAMSSLPLMRSDPSSGSSASGDQRPVATELVAFDPATFDPLRAGIDATDTAAAIFDPDDRLVFFNPMFRKLYDVQDGQQTFASIIRHCHATRRGPFIDTTDIDAWIHIAAEKRRAIPHRRFEVDLADGRWLWAVETTYGDGWMFLALMDLTAFKLKEIDLRIARDAAVMIAETDHLTGLATRGSIMRYLDECIDAQNVGSPLTLVIIDIDHFKHINDRLGHHAGDRVLERFGHQSTRLFRNSDRVGRIGGEEFLIVMPRTDEASARKAVERLRCQLQQPIQIGADSVACTFSAGI